MNKNNAPTPKPTVETDPKYGPVITLNPGSKFPFRFGPGKARMIVEHFAAIKKFADANPAKE